MFYGRIALWVLALGLVFSPSISSAMTQEEFCELCRAGTKEAIQAAIVAGADVNKKNKDGYLPLFLACNNPEAVKALIEAGANVNARQHDNASLLMLASYQKNIKFMQALLDSGADVNARSIGGFSALMLAAMDNEEPHQDSRAISLLLEAGANPKAVSSERKKAIDYAEQNKKINGTEEYWKLNDVSN